MSFYQNLQYLFHQNAFFLCFAKQYSRQCFILYGIIYNYVNASYHENLASLQLVVHCEKFFMDIQLCGKIKFVGAQNSRKDYDNFCLKSFMVSAYIATCYQYFIPTNKVFKHFNHM